MHRGSPSTVEPAQPPPVSDSLSATLRLPSATLCLGCVAGSIANTRPLGPCRLLACAGAAGRCFPRRWPKMCALSPPPRSSSCSAAASNGEVICVALLTMRRSELQRAAGPLLTWSSVDVGVLGREGREPVGNVRRSRLPGVVLPPSRWIDKRLPERRSPGQKNFTEASTWTAYRARGRGALTTGN